MQDVLHVLVDCVRYVLNPVRGLTARAYYLSLIAAVNHNHYLFGIVWTSGFNGLVRHDDPLVDRCQSVPR